MGDTERADVMGEGVDLGLGHSGNHGNKIDGQRAPTILLTGRSPLLLGGVVLPYSLKPRRTGHSLHQVARRTQVISASHKAPALLTFLHPNWMMICREYVRLRQSHGATLRYWGPFLLWPGVPAHAAEVKQKAFEQLNTANDQMRFHMQTCPACISV
jgi:hypothetical protein